MAVYRPAIKMCRDCGNTGVIDFYYRDGIPMMNKSCDCIHGIKRSKAMTTGDEGKVELPELPQNGNKCLIECVIEEYDWHGPFAVVSVGVHVGCKIRRAELIPITANEVKQLKQQLSDLRQRVRELEEELHRLKNPEPSRQPQQFTQEEAAELDKALEYWEKTKPGMLRDD